MNSKGPTGRVRPGHHDHFRPGGGSGPGFTFARLPEHPGHDGARLARTAHHGELNRGAADASGGAVDEQRAAPPDAELVKRARGRLDGGRQRGSAREAERRRDRRIEGQHRQLGLGRPLGGQAEHAIADGHVRNALAEFVDDARSLVAHGLRELPVHQALALLPVARVDTGRADRDPDLAGTRMRIGEIHDLQDLRPTEPAEPDCHHHSLRSRPGDRASRAPYSLPALAYRVCSGAWPKATGQARWGTGVWMSAARGAGVGRSGLVMKVAASTAAQANAAAQILLIWAKLDRNRAGSA